MKHMIRSAVVLFALTGPAMAQDAPPTRAKFEFTAQQVKDFGTSGVEILPAVSGFYYRVAHGTFVKREGDAFTITNSGHYVQIQYGNTAHTAANNFLVANVLNVTTEASSTGNPAVISYLTGAGGLVTSDIGGASLRMGVNAGGSYSGTGSDCILDLYYWLLPSDAGELDAVSSTSLP
jgi:hypothetical protein